MKPSVMKNTPAPPFNDSRGFKDTVQDDATEIVLVSQLDEIDVIFIVALILIFLMIVAVVCR